MSALSRRTLGAASLFGLALSPAMAFAQQMNPFENVELSQLSPQVRAQVQARMTGGQTVRGILETMLLNNISAKFPARKVTAVDFEKGTAVIEKQDGSLVAVPFDTSTLALKS